MKLPLYGKLAAATNGAGCNMFLVATPILAALTFGFILFGIITIATEVDVFPGFVQVGIGVACGFGCEYFLPDMLQFMHMIRQH